MRFSWRRIRVAFRDRVRLAIALVAALLIMTGVAAILSPAAKASGLSSVTDYAVPGGDPWGTGFDNTGRVWVALPGCDPSPKCSNTTPPGKLGLFDPATSTWIVRVSLPSGYGQPLFVQVDSAGKVWFTMPVTNTIGVYDPPTATVTQWAVPTAGGGPWDLAIDSSGSIWFTEHYVNKIGSFNPATQAFNEIATPATNSDPYGITIDHSGNVWFTENTDAVALIGEYTATSVPPLLKEYKIRNSNTAGTGLTPHLITIAPNGNPWWSEGWVSGIGTLNLSVAQPGTNNGVTEYFYTPTCSSCGSHTSGISADTLGAIWIDDSLQNTFGSIPVGGGPFTFYNSPSGGHPHDGMNVDSQNRIWFNEEFAGKLAEAIQSGSPPPSTTTTVPGSTTTTTTLPPGATLAADTFQRPNQSLWGTASDGLAWGGDANTAAAFSISGNTGLVSNTGSSSLSAVLGSSATDAEVFATVNMSAFSSGNWGDVLRWTDGNDWYKAYIDGASLVLQKKVAGSASILTSVPFSASGGTTYTIHFRIVGSTLSANVWPSTAAEPAGWMVSATDTSLTSGFSGMRFLTQAATATVTNFVSDNPDAPPPPTTTTSTTSTSTTSTSTTTTTLPTSTTTVPASTTTVPLTTTTSTTTTTTTVPPSTTTTSTTVPYSGGALAADNFQRANQALWGKASDGLSWGGDANTISAFSISGNAGLVSNTGSASYSAVLGPSATDSEVFGTATMSAFSGTNWGDVLRWTDGNNWYKAYIDGSNLILQKKVAGSASTIGSVSFSATSGTAYTIHFRVVGSTLSANVWASTGAEPAGWMVTATDTTFTSGFCGLRFLTHSGTATVTSFSADSPGGGSPPPSTTTTSSPTTSTTSTTSTTVPGSTTTSTTAPSGGALAADTFQRANQSLWGTASDGLAWGGDANTIAAFSISANAGLVSNSGSASYSAVLGPSATNSEVFAMAKMSAFSNSNWGDVLRWTDGNNWYKAFIDGSSLFLQKKVAGGTTILASVPFAASAGTTYTIHFRVVGSTLTANVWSSTAAEPAGWMVTATDTTLTSGFCGLRFLTQGGTVTVNSFQAKTA